jgi:hypothetical protein
MASHKPNREERPGKDSAHSPGHKKLNLKEQTSENSGGKVHFQNEAALNQMSDSDRIHRNESAQRRTITGASLGKKGQRDKE